MTVLVCRACGQIKPIPKGLPALISAKSQARPRAEQGAGNWHDLLEPSLESNLADWFVSLAATPIAAAVAWHRLSLRHHLEPDGFLTHPVQSPAE